MLLVQGYFSKGNDLACYVSMLAVNYGPEGSLKNTDAQPVLTSASRFLWAGFRIGIF